MEYTPISEVTAVEHPAADRAGAYGLDSIIVDGNDADAVYRVARDAAEKARNGGGPLSLRPDLSSLRTFPCRPCDLST